MIIAPTNKHIRQANRQAKKVGGTVKVYEKHQALLTVNGETAGYFITREDFHGRAFMEYDKFRDK